MPAKRCSVEVVILERSRLPSRLLPLLSIVYAVSVVVFWLVIRYLGDRWWPATVLLFVPRWPILLPLVILLPLSARLKKLFWLPILTTLFVFTQLMGLSVPWQRLLSHAPAGQSLRVLFCNVHWNELNTPAFDQYLQASRPQVVLLEDFAPRDLSPRLKDPRWHRYQLGQIFIASVFPIEHVHDLHLERIKGEEEGVIAHYTGAAACFDLQTPAGPFHVVNIHLASPHAGLRTVFRNLKDGIWRLNANSTRRWNESQVIHDWIATQPGPLIAAGDFNTPAESPIYRHFWADYPDAFPTAGIGLGFTHLSPLSELRIDHLITAPGVTCNGYLVGPPCGTPHRPVVVDLVIKLWSPVSQ